MFPWLMKRRVSVFAACDLTSAMRPDGDTDFVELGDGPVMRRVSDLLARRRRGIDRELALEPGPPYELLKDELGHGGTADGPMADEENAMHVASGLSMDDFTAQLTRAREGGAAWCRARQHGLRVRRLSQVAFQWMISQHSLPERARVRRHGAVRGSMACACGGFASGCAGSAPQWCAASRAGSPPNGLPLVVEIGLARTRVRTAPRCVIASVPPHTDCMMCPNGRVGCNA